MKTTIYPNQGKSYFTAIDALEDEGFKYLGEAYTLTKRGNVSRTYKIFEGKKGGKYAYAGMDHFNTTIYEIYIKPVRSKELYYN